MKFKIGDIVQVRSDNSNDLAAGQVGAIIDIEQTGGYKFYYLTPLKGVDPHTNYYYDYELKKIV